MGRRNLTLVLLTSLGCSAQQGAPRMPPEPLVAWPTPTGAGTASAHVAHAAPPAIAPAATATDENKKAFDSEPEPDAPAAIEPEDDEALEDGEAALAAEPGHAPDEQDAREEPTAREEGGDAADEPAAPASRSAPKRERPDPRLLSDGEIGRRVRSDLASLGPLSIGRPSSGALINGVRLQSSKRWIVVDPGATWGTQETLDYLSAAIDAVREQFAETQPLPIGHISSRRGGALSPHRSHQSGRDVDVGYYYRADGKPTWYRRATAANLDSARTWAFVRALLTETDVQYIFINASIQKLLKEHALTIGEDATWLDSVFQYGSSGAGAIIRHVRGHDTHIHVRFYNPVAQELGRRAYAHLVQRGLVKPREYFVTHRVKKGETLGALARKFDTTVEAIQKANGLRSQRIIAGRTYRMPRKGQVAMPQKVIIPPRRLPPAGPSQPAAKQPNKLGQKKAGARSM